MAAKRKQLRETQLVMFEPSASWRPPDLNDLPSWQGEARVGIDCETFDPLIKVLGPGPRRGGRMIGFSFAFEDGRKFYLPWGHEDNRDNLPAENCKAYLRDQLRAFDGDLVGANLPYELDYMAAEAMACPNVRRYLDVQVADPLIYERHMKYSLDEILKRHGMEGKNEALLEQAAAEHGIDPKGDMWRLAARYVGDYAEDDALKPLMLLRKQEHLLEDDGLLRVWDLECRLLPVLARMRVRGVAVDTGRLERMHDYTITEEQAQLDLIKRETGVSLGLNTCNNAKNLRPALAAAGLDVSASTAEELERMQHPVAQAMVRARKMWKIRTTFVRSINDYMTAGRIHCTFNQLRTTNESTDDESGGKFGRLSCVGPNMQQQPGDRDPIGPLWRAIFRPDEGKLWASNDFSQQEPKWSFHFCAIMEQNGVAGMTGALDLCNRFHADPKLDVYEPLAEACGIPRKQAKAVWLGRCYGRGGGAMAEGLGMSTQYLTYSRKLNRKVPVDSPEGQEAIASGSFSWRDAGPECQAVINAFDGAMPFLKAASAVATQRVAANGYVTTVSGRRCHFEKREGKYFDAYRAFNRVIQGSAADQTKQAVVDMDAAGMALQLQVHDEINWSVENREEAEAGAQLMRDAIPMLAPTKVDVEVGDSWGDSMKKGVWTL